MGWNKVKVFFSKFFDKHKKDVAELGKKSVVEFLERLIVVVALLRLDVQSDRVLYFSKHLLSFLVWWWELLQMVLFYFSPIASLNQFGHDHNPLGSNVGRNFKRYYSLRHWLFIGKRLLGIICCTIQIVLIGLADWIDRIEPDIGCVTFLYKLLG